MLLSTGLLDCLHGHKILAIDLKIFQLSLLPKTERSNYTYINRLNPRKLSSHFLIPKPIETPRIQSKKEIQEIPFSKELTDNYCALRFLYESIIIIIITPEALI